mgnify:CR=1 FL=1
MNACAADRWRWEVEGSGPLFGHWAGWRIAGRELVTPDGDRIRPERLRGLLFREASEKHLRGSAKQKKAGGQEWAAVVPFPARVGGPDEAA